MLIKPSDWYSEDYFYPKKRKYVDQFGVEREYIGPAKQWMGFSDIAKYIKDNINPKTILDIGCSAGCFVDFSRQMGIESLGYDISKFAINNCLPGAKGFVKVKDITKSNPDSKKYNMITAFDLLEHIYEKDLDKCLQYIYESSKIEGWFFFCIATARELGEIWSHPDENTPVPPDRTWLAVSGHVHIKTIDWWIKKLESFGIKTNYEEMCKFQLWRKNSELRDVESWSIRNVYVGRKI